MALGVLVLVLLCIDISHELYLLVGWTGDGKTTFCNTYDGTICGKTGSTAFSVTSEVYFGNNFIDSPGFGENRVGHIESGLQASLDSLDKILMALNTTNIKGIIWMMNCGLRRPSSEGFELMKLLNDMVGKVPIIVVFNPLSKTNECLLLENDFLDVCDKNGVTVKKIYHFDKFNLPDLNALFKENYRVIVPANLREILQRKDPRFLAKMLKDIRKLQCETLPGHLEKLRQGKSELESSIKPEVAEQCSPQTCQLEKTTISDCNRVHCAQREVVSEGFSLGPVSITSSDAVCVREESYNDEGCLQRNKQRIEEANKNYEICLKHSNQDLESCRKSKGDLVAEIIKKNQSMRNSIKLLIDDESTTIARLRTCNNIKVTL